MRKDLEKIYKAAIEAVNPYNSLIEIMKIEKDTLLLRQKDNTLSFDLNNYNNIYVVGAGKATSPMALAAEKVFGDRITSGIICVKYGYVENLKKIKTFEAAHPVPDEAGNEAAQKIYDLITKAGENDLVISLISGGGSALLPLPVQGISLQNIAAVTSLLLKSGASIHEINSFRKHLSRLKGGGMARAAYPATVINLMISDVVGDDMDVIASGPFVADTSTFAYVSNVIEKYKLEFKIPQNVLTHIKSGIEGKIEDTPDEAEDCFKKVYNVICSSNIIALESAKKTSESLGYNTVVLSSMIEGDNEQVVDFHEDVLFECIKSGNPASLPACILSGGESTIVVKGGGLGGRNMEFAMHMAKRISKTKNILVASVGTDGTDGPTDAAGAFVESDTYLNCMKSSIDFSGYMSDNNSYHLFEKTGTLIKTGPTNTNVMDVRIILIGN